MYENRTCTIFYNDGIAVDDPKCPVNVIQGGKPVVNQWVTIVGYAELTKYHPKCSGYWIVKNSRGTNWGEKGYLKACIEKDSSIRYGHFNIRSHI